MIKVFSNFKEKTEIKFKFMTFPAGERHVSLLKPNDIPFEIDNQNCKVNIVCNFESSDDIIDLCLIADIFKDNPKTLDLSYVPFGRQDRRVNKGEAFSLKVFADIINSLNFEEVYIVDPHSDTSANLIKNSVVINQTSALMRTYHTFNIMNFDGLIAPDAGAAKKTEASALFYQKPFFQGYKTRNKHTGVIEKFGIYDIHQMKSDGHYLVVDDICDGGGTFIALAQSIKQYHPDITLYLYVTHGIFSKGMDDLNVHFAQVLCYNDMRKTTETGVSE